MKSRSPQHNEFTREELEAIYEWMRLYGRNWKRALRNAWMTGNYEGFKFSPQLQQLRNNRDRGPAWLDNFRMADALDLYNQHDSQFKPQR